jgi:hypothetical protein
MGVLTKKTLVHLNPIRFLSRQVASEKLSGMTNYDKITARKWTAFVQMLLERNCPQS